MTEKGEAGENPLVPNAKLRALYTTMLEARRLEEAVAKRTSGSRKKPASIRGHEAVRASSVLQLGEVDLVSDSSSTAGMGLILGGKAPELLKAFSAPKQTKPKLSRLLPPVEDTEQRLELALGAALGLKAQDKQGVVVAFIPNAALSHTAYRRILKQAAKLELPVIFVVLSRTVAVAKGDQEAIIAPLSSKSGVPGIPVDAADSVALYRVVQESLGRTRGGDGPVLIECILWKTSGAKGTPSDPIDHLKSFLAGRKIATPAWFQKAEKAAVKRLGRKR